MIKLKKNEQVLGFCPNTTHAAVIGKKTVVKKAGRNRVVYGVLFIDFPTWVLLQTGVGNVEQVALMQIRSDKEIEKGFDFASNFKGYLGVEEIEEDPKQAAEDEEAWVKLAKSLLEDEDPDVDEPDDDAEEEDDEDEDKEEEIDLDEVDEAADGGVEIVEEEPPRRRARSGSVR